MKYHGAEESGVQFEITSGIRISVKLVSISTDIDQTAMKLTGDIHDPQRMIHSNDFGSPLKQPLAQKLYLSNTWYTTMNLEIIQRIFDVIVYIHGPRRINHSCGDPLNFALKQPVGQNVFLSKHFGRQQVLLKSNGSCILNVTVDVHGRQRMRHPVLWQATL